MATLVNATLRSERRCCRVGAEVFLRSKEGRSGGGGGPRRHRRRCRRLGLISKSAVFSWILDLLSSVPQLLIPLSRFRWCLWWRLFPVAPSCFTGASRWF